MHFMLCTSNKNTCPTSQTNMRLGEISGTAFVSNISFSLP